MKERRAGTTSSTYAIPIVSDGCLLCANAQYGIREGVSMYDRCLLFLTATMKAPCPPKTNQPLEERSGTGWMPRCFCPFPKGAQRHSRRMRSRLWGRSGTPQSQARILWTKQRQHEVVRGVTACWDALAWLGEVILTARNVAVHTRAVAKDHKTD